MKTLRYIIVGMTLITLLATLGCDSGGNESQPDPFAQQVELLINGGKPWVATGESSVIKDGFDVSDEFIGFSLTFSEGIFRTENAISTAWPTEGNWELDKNNVNTILRSDGIVMQSQISGNILTLTFTAGEPSGGRMNGVVGEFQFSLISQ